MKAVSSYPIPHAPSQEFSLAMPEGSLPLRVSADGAHLYLWAEGDTESPMEIRTFRVIGTGFPIEDDAIYIDSLTAKPLIGARGGFTSVLHLYEVPDASF